MNLLDLQVRPLADDDPDPPSARPAAAGAADEHLLVPAGPMRGLLDLADRIAIGAISVLVVGETGVGKEVLADRIHRRSRRAAHPLLKLNCAAIPEALLESELFGHERGAFTGAAVAKPGLLELAHGGTVFLDEIGELPPTIQAKLLRVIEQHELLRLGGLRPRRVDVRFVAATHRDLDAAIAAGRFREDLYYRLAGVTLHVPPLRERPAELEPLVARFAARAAQSIGGAPPAISRDALALLRAYRWPGNIRELRNVIERATLLCDGTIEPWHLPGERMPPPLAFALPADAPAIGRVREHAEAEERRAIQDALARTRGNQTAAARMLGIARRTLTKKLDAHGFDRPRKRRR